MADLQLMVKFLLAMWPLWLFGLGIGCLGWYWEKDGWEVEE